MEKLIRPTGVYLCRVKRAGGRSETSLYQQHLHPQGSAGKPPLPEMGTLHPRDLLLRLLLTTSWESWGNTPSTGNSLGKDSCSFPEPPAGPWRLPRLPCQGTAQGSSTPNLLPTPLPFLAIFPLVTAHIPQPSQILLFTIIFFIFFPNHSVPRVIKSMINVPPRKSRDQGEPQPPLITQHCFSQICHVLCISRPWPPVPGVLPWTPKVHLNRNLG